MEKKYKISELRSICQATRESSTYKMTWFEKNIFRFFSIFITYSAARLGLSANTLTYTNNILGFLIVPFFISGKPVLWLIGSILFYLRIMLDFSDGELARLTGTTSAYGEFLESSLPHIVNPIIVFSWYWGLSVAYSLLYLKYLGVLTIILMLSWSVGDLLLSKMTKGENNQIEIKNNLLKILKMISSIFFSIQGLVNALLICAVLAFIGDKWQINAIQQIPQIIYVLGYSIARLASFLLLIRRVRIALI